MIPTGESRSTLEINLSQWHSAHHKSHMDWPGIELGLCSDRSITNCLSHGTYACRHRDPMGKWRIYCKSILRNRNCLIGGHKLQITVYMYKKYHNQYGTVYFTLSELPHISDL